MASHPMAGMLMKKKKKKSKKKTNPRLEDVYEVDFDVLGKGAFGTVHQGRHRAKNTLHAVKIVPKIEEASDALGAARREVMILEKLGHHPGVVRLDGWFEDKKRFSLVMELITGGELLARIAALERYGERDASMLMKELVDALAFLHASGVAHRDVKPENVLLSSPTENTGVVLADFGLSQILRPNGELRDAAGTADYAAPEILARALDGSTPCDRQCDMWSLGVVAYVLLRGKQPFSPSSPGLEAMLEAVSSAEFPLPLNDEIWKQVSEQGRDFVHRLIVRAPEERMTAEEALHHPWLVEGEALCSVHRASVRSGIQSIAARRKLRGAALALRAARAFASIPLEVRERAATRIAANFRGWQARKE